MFSSKREKTYEILLQDMYQAYHSAADDAAGTPKEESIQVKKSE